MAVTVMIEDKYVNLAEPGESRLRTRCTGCRRKGWLTREPIEVTVLCERCFEGHWLRGERLDLR